MQNPRIRASGCSFAENPAQCATETIQTHHSAAIDNHRRHGKESSLKVAHICPRIFSVARFNLHSSDSSMLVPHLSTSFDVVGHPQQECHCFGLSFPGQRVRDIMHGVEHA